MQLLISTFLPKVFDVAAIVEGRLHLDWTWPAFASLSSFSCAAKSAIDQIFLNRGEQVVSWSNLLRIGATRSGKLKE